MRDTLAAALESLVLRPDRDAKGRFVRGNLAGSTTMEHAAGFWQAVAPAKREMVERVESDLAVDGDATATLAGLIDAYAEVTLLRRSLFLRLAKAGGVVTARGKIRAAFTGYLRALDREHRLAVQIGLERRAKPVPSLEEVMRGRGG